jgi:hypothetical protein
MPTDFIGLFTLLASSRVRFVVVGSLALLLHGLDRLTADVDRERLRASLQAALQLAYQSGAIKTRRPDATDSLVAEAKSP